MDRPVGSRRLKRSIPFIGVAIAVVLLGGAQSHASQIGEWTQDFGLDRAELVSTGQNPYFVLEPGYFLTLEHGPERLVVRVLSQTRVVDGVETRVVEERETKGGTLV